MYTTASFQQTAIVPGEIPGNVAPTSLPAIPAIYEGGEYTISLWLYVNSYNINRNARKHVLEIGGAQFSTLLVGLGAFKNTMFIRTHSKDASASMEGFQDPRYGTGNAELKQTFDIMKDYSQQLQDTYMSQGVERDPCPIGGYDKITGVPCARMTDNNGPLANRPKPTPNPPAPKPPTPTPSTPIPAPKPAPPNASDSTADGSLTRASVEAFFKPLALDDSILDTNTACDLPEIDMQRWTQLTVNINGRTTDVYLDGKLARSCVSKSYYKVDPTGVKINLLDYGGFDGHIQGVTVFNYSLTPSDIYNSYVAGPTGAGTSDILSWLFAPFKRS